MPFQALPLELISEIFILCVWGLKIDPASLCSYNRHLRNGAIENPRLWSSIKLQRGTHVELEELSRRFERSLDLPFDLYVDVPTVLLSDASFCTAFIAAVQPQLRRIRSLEIHMSHDGILDDRDSYQSGEEDEEEEEMPSRSPFKLGVEFFLAGLSSPAPTLDHLEIALPSKTSYVSELFLGSSTPALKTLKISALPKPFWISKMSSLQALELNLSKLYVELDLRRDWLRTLGPLQRLRRLKIAFPSDNQITNWPAITLAEVREFSCKLNFASGTRMDRVKFPRLEVFSIEDCSTFGEDIWTFVQTHSSTLLSVSIVDRFRNEEMVGIAEPHSSVPQTLVTLPRLRTLVLNFKNSQLLSAWCNVSTPSLEEFDVSASEGAMVAFWSFLARTSHGLESLTLSACGDNCVDSTCGGHKYSFARLQKLSASRGLGDCLLGATEMAPQLKAIRLEGSPPLILRITRLDLPSLENLSIYTSSSILSSIAAPALRELVFYEWRTSSEPNEPELPKKSLAIVADFISRHAPSLVTVKLRGGGVIQPHDQSTSMKTASGDLIALPSLHTLCQNIGEMLTNSWLAPNLLYLTLDPHNSLTSIAGSWDRFVSVRSLTLILGDDNSELLHNVFHLRRIQHLELRLRFCQQQVDSVAMLLLRMQGVGGNTNLQDSATLDSLSGIDVGFPALRSLQVQFSEHWWFGKSSDSSSVLLDDEEILDQDTSTAATNHSNSRCDENSMMLKSEVGSANIIRIEQPLRSGNADPNQAKQAEASLASLLPSLYPKTPRMPSPTWSSFVMPTSSWLNFLKAIVALVKSREGGDRGARPIKKLKLSVPGREGRDLGVPNDVMAWLQNHTENLAFVRS